MAEVIDVLFVGWCLLAVLVYALGHLYEQQLRKQLAGKGRREQRAHGRPDTTNLDDFWAPKSRPSYSSGGGGGAYRAAADQLARDSTGAYQQTNYSYSYDSNSSPNNNNNNWNYNSATSQTLNSYAGPVDGRYDNGPSYAQFGVSASLPPSYYPDGQRHQYQYQQQQQQQHQQHQQQLDYESLASTRAQPQQQSRASPAAVIPTATGFSADSVEWVNSILYLFYTQPDKYGPIISENVQRSLNEKLSNLVSSSGEHGHLNIEFESVNQELSSRPELTNIRTECESDKSISASCKIYNQRISFNLSIRRLSSLAAVGLAGAAHERDELHYELVLQNLEGKLKSVAMLNDKLLVLQFLERPDTKILLKPIVMTAASDLYGAAAAGPMSMSTSAPSGLAKGELIREEALVQLILETLAQVVVDLYFGADLDFPQFKSSHSQSAYANYKHKLNSMLKGSAHELKRQLKQHDLFGGGGGGASDQQHQSSKERKVFVKIIAAHNLNYNQNVTCLMELDAPRQQAISSTKQGSNPVWDEHFLFNVSDKSQELTFELWDSLNTAPIEQQQQQQQQEASGSSWSLRRGQTHKSPARWAHKSELTSQAKFLGLARVQLDELRANPVQKASLPLQPIGPAADLSNSVGGELQLELLFLEHSSTGASAGSAALQSAGAPARVESLKKSNSLNSLAYHQGDIVSIDRKLTPSGYVITTTTITKQPQARQRAAAAAVQTAQQEQLLRVQGSQSQAGSSSVATEQSFEELEMRSRAAGEQSTSETRADELPAPPPGRLSRSRSRSRSLLRAIKKRFSLSRTRSRSVGEPGPPHTPTSLADTSSTAGRPEAGASSYLEADFESHSRASSEASAGPGQVPRARSVPATREPSEVPTIVINKGGRHSDTASAFTFAHPKSQLVIEVLEPTVRADGNGNHNTRGLFKYYAVADEATLKRKWRKRGTKLHLFNEHQFVACHLAGSATCHLCGRVFSRRPGKQGYKCRQCHLLSHKQCHVKVDHNCPYAARDGLQLEFIDADPPASLMDELSAGSGGAPGGPRESGARQRAASSTLVRVHSSGRTPALRMSAKSVSMEADER